MARAQSPAGGGRLAQIRTTFTLARQYDPKLVPALVLPALAVLVVLILVGIFTNHVITLTILAVLGALLVASLIFGRRVSRVMMAQVEGKPGASMAVAQSLRGPWKVDQTPAVATRSQDVVFRVVGRPGVILLGEGAPTRLGQLLANEKRRVARVVGEVPIYAVQVGDAEGQVPLRQLQRHLMKLPRNIKPGQLDIVESRLRALSVPGGVPLPKGPMPRNARQVQRRAR